VQSRAKRILLGIIGVAILAVVAIGLVYRSNVLPTDASFDFKPVPKHAPTLNQADIEKVLGPSDLETQLGPHRFRTFRRARQVPPTVKQSFTNLTGLPFDMGDPHGPMSSDDMTSGAPLRRLVFLAINADSAVLVYKQGGFAGTLDVVVFWYGDGGRDWGATLDKRVENISDLRKTIQNGQFQVWPHIGQ